MRCCVRWHDIKMRMETNWKKQTKKDKKWERIEIGKNKQEQQTKKG